MDTVKNNDPIEYHTNSDNSYTYRCGFSIPNQRFHFHGKWMATDNIILQILALDETPSNSPQAAVITRDSQLM